VGFVTILLAARIVPFLSAFAVAAVLESSCGHSIYSTSSASPVPTSTATSGGSAFLYAGNNVAGSISEYRRSQAQGALKPIATTASGTVQGPVGLTADPTGKFLYVANSGDGLHQFQIAQSSGRLTPLNGKTGLVRAGNAPQWVAISSSASGTFAYAPNFADGSVSQYAVETNGTLKRLGEVGSNLLTNPFGEVATSGFLYVSNENASNDTKGTVVSFPINSDGTLDTANASAVKSSSQLIRDPAVVILDPAGNFVYLSDKTTGYVSVFATAGGALSAVQTVAPAPGAPGGAVGLAIASISGNEFLYVTNSNANSISRYIVNTTTGKLSDPEIVANTLAFPTGLAVGTGNSATFLYVANQKNGSITRFQIKPNSGALTSPITVASGSGPQFLAIAGS
jgi:6-phosphogluconolactonase (cycloisomerase 2 family)